MSIEIGTRIRRIRHSKDFNQNDIARQLEITPGAYAKIERGETDPSASRLLQIAKILKVDVVVFFKDQVPEQMSSSKNTITRAEWELMSKHVLSLAKEMEKVQARLETLAKPTGKKK